MRIKAHVFVMILLLCSGVVAGQESAGDFFSVNFSQQTFRNDSLKGNSKSLEAFLTIPLYAKKGSLVGARVNYTRTVTANVSGRFDQVLTAAETNIFWQKKMGEKRTFQLTTRAGVYSDWEDVSSRDFRFRIAGNISFTHSQKFTSGIGLAYSRQFTAHQISPFISARYKINDRWSVGGLFPVKPKLIYRLNKNMRWTTEVAANVESYRLSGKTYNHAIIEYSGWYGMTGMEWILKKHHKWVAGLGYSLRQKMRYYEDMPVSSWKLFTVNLSEKHKPISEIKTSGLRWLIGYNFVF